MLQQGWKAFAVYYGRRKMMKGLCLAAAWVCSALPLAASAQSPAAQAGSANVEQQYKNCANGYYTGPRPGRIRFTKDTWLWVVTPEFAKKFCMPAEFISEELKGAEAIAFKVDEDPNEEVCGWADNAAVCGREKNLRFEIYMKASVNLPKKRDLPYYNPATLPSKFLIAKTDIEHQASQRTAKSNPKTGALGVFESQQVGLQGIKDGKIVWPITTLYSELYFKEVFEGIDFMAFHGQTGRFKNPRMEKQDIQRFVISFSQLGDVSSTDKGKTFKDFAHVIELPKSFSDKIRARDKEPGMSVEDLAKRAFGVVTK
ncbi:MAG: hypothetical protein V4488_04800 [Pseudomonadota bacterium]